MGAMWMRVEGWAEAGSVLFPGLLWGSGVSEPLKGLRTPGPIPASPSGDLPH